MRKILVSLVDKKAGTWYAPMAVRALPEAMRMFAEALQDKQALCSQYPMDFALYSVGEFDDVSGEVIGATCSLVIEGSALVRQLGAQAAGDSSQLPLIEGGDA